MEASRIVAIPPQGSVIDRATDWAFTHAVPLTRPRALIGGMSAVALISVFDALVGPDIELTVLYAIPMGVIAWNCGRRIGLAMCAITAVASEAVEALIDPPGTALWVLAAMVLARFGALAVISVAVATVRGALERASDLAEHDPLTRLLNRRALFERLREEIARSERHPAALTILYFDLDNFKAVNDSQGHEAGDRLLRELATVMTITLRPEDLSARMGGDEFVGVLPQTDPTGARASAGRLLEQLNEVAGEYGASVSLGVVTFLTPPDSTDLAVSLADAEMYRAKRAGGHQSQFLVRD